MNSGLYCCMVTSDDITGDHATVETWVHISATEEELEYSGGHTEEYLQGGGVVLE